MDDTPYARLEARLSALEDEVRALRAAHREPSVARPPMPAATVPAPRARPPRSTAAIETLLAGRGLQLAGLLLILIGAAFFLDLAVTRGWIGPAERVILGLLVGAALIVVAATRISATYVLVAEALIGLGAGICYLALWSAVTVFADVSGSRGAAFAAMIAVTATLAALGATRRSERLAFLGALGGLLTPLLLASPTPDRVVLATYILVLTGGTLALAARYAFARIEILALVGAVAYAGAFAPDASHGWTLLDAHVVASLFFLVFAVAFSIGAPTAIGRRVGLLVGATSAYVVILEALMAANQTALGIDLLGLTAVLLVSANVTAWPRALLFAYAALAIGTVTLALAAFFVDFTRIDAFIVEAAVLAAIDRRLRDPRLTYLAVGLLALAGLVLLGDATVLGHARALEIAFAFALWLAAAAFVARARPDMPPDARRLARIAIDVMALAGLSRACSDVFFNQGSGVAQFAISALWSAYAAALFADGLRRKRELLRWEGLALFGLTILKVFTVDLASVDVEYRVGSFVLLGIVLFAVSAWYTRTMAKSAPETPAP